MQGSQNKNISASLSFFKFLGTWSNMSIYFVDFFSPWQNHQNDNLSIFQFFQCRSINKNNNHIFQCILLIMPLFDTHHGPQSAIFLDSQNLVSRLPIFPLFILLSKFSYKTPHFGYKCKHFFPKLGDKKYIVKAWIDQREKNVKLLFFQCTTTDLVL